MASIFGTERRESNEIVCQFDQIRSRSIRKLIKFFSKFKSPAVGLRDQVVDVIVTWTQKRATELDKDSALHLKVWLIDQTQTANRMFSI